MTHDLLEVPADDGWLLLLVFLAAMRWVWRSVASRRWGPVLDAKGHIAADRAYRRYAGEPGGRDLRSGRPADSPDDDSLP